MSRRTASYRRTSPSTNALKTMRARPELKGTLLAKGTWDYAIVDALTPQPGDIVIPKTRYSGFFNTNIDSVLRARGIRNLVFTGIATNVCVESSLRDAFHLEYFAVVLEDATHHAGPPFVQQAALYNIEKFFGWVSTVADFCGAIGAGRTNLQHVRFAMPKTVVLPPGTSTPIALRSRPERCRTGSCMSRGHWRSTRIITSSMPATRRPRHGTCWRPSSR